MKKQNYVNKWWCRNNYLRKCKVGKEKLFCFACIHTLLKKGSHVDILINEKKRSANVIIEQGRLHNPKIIQLLLGCCYYFFRQCLVFRRSKYKMAVNTLITVFSQNEGKYGHFSGSETVANLQNSRLGGSLLWSVGWLEVTLNHTSKVCECEISMWVDTIDWEWSQRKK